MREVQMESCSFHKDEEEKQEHHNLEETLPTLSNDSPLVRADPSSFSGTGLSSCIRVITKNLVSWKSFKETSINLFLLESWTPWLAGTVFPGGKEVDWSFFNHGIIHRWPHSSAYYDKMDDMNQSYLVLPIYTIVERPGMGALRAHTACPGILSAEWLPAEWLAVT